MLRATWLLLPLLLLVGLVGFILAGRPLERLSASAPPVEEISVERVRLRPGAISLTVRADGSKPVAIAQVQVDAAYRVFTLDPPGPIARLSRATVSIPYPWIDGETHSVVMVTSTGVTVEHTIDVALATPTLTGSSFTILALVGLLLGLAPVATGMLAYPAMQGMGAGPIRFLMALTIGLLVYLLIDTVREGLEAGNETLGRLRGGTLVWVAAGLTTLVLMAVGRRGGKAPAGVALAGFIALGIGLHNLGEGLVVGAAFATGSAALATFLVVGFVIHNVTEGIGIAVPMVRERPPLIAFVLLALLAGLPAVLGVWAGSLAVSPYFVALCFGVGAGAILQVIVELTALTVRDDSAAALTSPVYAGGIATGLAVMYATALLV